MHRLAIAALLVAAAGPVAAQQCYYYWATDCFEIRDAANRDIVHHVLLSPEPRAFEAPEGQCRAVLDRALGLDGRAEAIRRFNKVLGRVEGFGCKRLENLEPMLFTDGPRAWAEHGRLQTGRAFKEIHVIRRLPGP